MDASRTRPPSEPPLQLPLPLPLPIPSFYRILFTTIDPILGLIGAVLALFSPTTTLTSFTPHFVQPIATETTVLLASSAGWHLGMAFLQLVLLRRTNELQVWRAVQGALIPVDLAMFVALVRVLRQEGRLDKMRWRSEDWVNVVMYISLLVIRLAFLSGIGMDAPGDPDEDDKEDDKEHDKEDGKEKMA